MYLVENTTNYLVYIVIIIITRTDWAVVTFTLFLVLAIDIKRKWEIKVVVHPVDRYVVHETKNDDVCTVLEETDWVNYPKDQIIELRADLAYAIFAVIFVIEY